MVIQAMCITWRKAATSSGHAMHGDAEPLKTPASLLQSLSGYQAVVPLQKGVVPLPAPVRLRCQKAVAARKITMGEIRPTLFTVMKKGLHARRCAETQKMRGCDVAILQVTSSTQLGLGMAMLSRNKSKDTVT
eukprot:TRINITY_DN17707_c0_g1_i3.p1 TRINITY_DN17707_c0_g1~~TRINITY_DN17707_c0_g1_i3.p1  ORF type:complete len:133 (+),score=7.30 TRINITY_DN17707_c0_g1_i3:106-504(+)